MYAQTISPEFDQIRSSQSLESAAKRLYDKVAGQSLLAGLRKLFGQDNRCHLHTLDEVLQQVRIQGQQPLGVKRVDVRRIVGTAAPGRKQDFDIDFRPLQEHNKERWMGVAAAWLSGRRLGRVQLVQVGDVYFVEDGHHRVSVARAMGEEEMEAEVVMVLGTGSLALPHSERQERREVRLALQPAAA